MKRRQSYLVRYAKAKAILRSVKAFRYYNRLQRGRALKVVLGAPGEIAGIEPRATFPTSKGKKRTSATPAPGASGIPVEFIVGTLKPLADRTHFVKGGLTAETAGISFHFLEEKRKAPAGIPEDVDVDRLYYLYLKHMGKLLKTP